MKNEAGIENSKTGKKGGTSRRNFLNFIIGGGLLGWIISVFYPVFS